MRLRNKLFFTNFFMVLTAFLVMGLVIINFVHQKNLHSVYQQLINQSYFSQSYINQYLNTLPSNYALDEEGKNQLQEMLTTQSGLQVGISFTGDEDLTSEEEAALRGDTAYYVDTKGEAGVFNLAFPIYQDGEVIASARFRYYLDHLEEMRRDLLFIFMGSFIIIFIISLIINYGLSYHLVKPLEKLSKSMIKFSKGEFNELVVVDSGDEIEELTKLFNQMGLEIQRKIKELIEEQEKQKRFLDSVTHEIRTPLTNIMGYTDLIGRVESVEDKARYSSYVEQEGKRLIKMVDDLLHLSRLKRYENPLQKEALNLKETVNEVLEMMEVRLQNNGFKVEKDLDDIYQEFDKGKVEQVLFNLLDNSIKYSQGKNIKIALKNNGPVKLTIEDDGIGIRENDLKNIFTPFYRVEKSRSRKLGGAGLRLSICKELISRHGWELEIDSTEGRGTIVTIWIQD